MTAARQFERSGIGLPRDDHLSTAADRLIDIWPQPVFVPDGAPAPAWWLGGAHGGAGVSSLAASWVFAGDAMGAFPGGFDEESPFVLVVAREHAQGIGRAHDLITQHLSGHGGPTTLVGLITVARASGQAGRAATTAARGRHRPGRRSALADSVDRRVDLAHSGRVAVLDAGGPDPHRPQAAAGRSRSSAGRRRNRRGDSVVDRQPAQPRQLGEPMLTQILLDTTHTAVLAIEQPESVAPPMAPKVWRIVGVILWTMTIGAVVGIIVGGGWMWVDHVSDRGANRW
ncbi:hypothetical protein GS528_17145 [Rhodococcus hoagii]|nr:hypothetical protein [Prescottella equi]